jgi:long-subunit fatty acid transport protein
MRRARFLVLAAVFLALPIWAQNTSVESLGGLQFNFGNPGARSLGMGGAFLGLADDASAAEANPAGLTILRKAEFSIEGRNYLEQQVQTTSGVFPDLERTAFSHSSDRIQLAFASAVIPVKNKFTFGLYFHEPLRNVGSQDVVPVEGSLLDDPKVLPTFYLPRGGTPVTQQECEAIVRQTNDFFSCVEFTLNPYVSVLDVKLQTFGLAAAWQVHPKFSIGVGARLQTFSESALTLRVTPDFDLDSVTAQATGVLNETTGEIEPKKARDTTFSAGFKWSPTDKVSIGGVVKQGAEFDAPTFFANADTGFGFITAAETKFHMPDIAGLGIAVRPIPALTVAFDAVFIKYSNLVDDFFSFSESVRELSQPYEAKDVTELHLGGEYFFSTKIPVAVRAGYWFDPAHSTEYVGPLNDVNRVAEAVIFPKGEDASHIAVGAGLAFSRFQIDAAYDSSKRFKVGSISIVTRF